MLQVCHKVQVRLERLVEGLEKQAVTVARQAARLAAGKRLRVRHPKSDVAAHAVELAQAQYLASSLRYLSAELRRLLEVVVLGPTAGQGVLPSHVRPAALGGLTGPVGGLAQSPAGSPRPASRPESPHAQGLADANSDWLAILGYPPEGAVRAAQLSTQQHPALALVA